MLTALAIVAPALLLYAGWRWLFGPVEAPPGWDVVPDEWTVEEARRVMQMRDEE